MPVHGESAALGSVSLGQQRVCHADPSPGPVTTFSLTIGGLNAVKVFRTSDFLQVATIPVGALPHGIWPSGDGNRVYVGLENGDGVTAIDTLTHKVIATVPVGQAPQALTYVCNAVPSGSGTQNLQSLGVAGQVAHLALSASAAQASNVPTSVSLFDQGLIQVQVLEAGGLRIAAKAALRVGSR